MPTGNGWGESGFIRLQREEAGQDLFCGVDNTPLDGSACAGQTEAYEVCGCLGMYSAAAYPLVEAFTA